MKFTCEKADIVNAVTVASRATNTKAVATMSILSYVLLTAEGNKVKICGNNNELSIETAITAKVDEPGSIALEAVFLGNVVRNMPDGEVTVKANLENKTEVKGGKVKFTMPGRDAKEFPEVHEIEKGKAIAIAQITLKDIIRQTIFSASPEDMNPLMTGMLFEVKGDKLKTAAIDGHRIAIRYTDLRQMYDDCSVIIPVKNLAEVARAITGPEVKIYFTPTQVAFDDGEAMIVSRLISGEFFDVDRMVKTEPKTEVKVKRDDIVRSLERSALVAKESLRKPVVLNIKEGSIDIYSESNAGAYYDGVAAEVNGESLKIGFNPRFLVDALKAIDDDDITLHFSESRTPVIIRDDGNYIYIVLPISFHEVANTGESGEMAA